jgi:tubulysin polyketide synthase-like protein
VTAVAGLVGALRDRGVRLWADGDRVRFDAPAHALGDQDRAAIAERKAEVLVLLVAEGMTAGDPALWDRLLILAADVDDLATRLERVRRRGCALTVVDGQVRFGPFDDFAGCAWSDATSWERDYAHYLRRFEPVLVDLLVALLPTPAEAVASPAPAEVA